MAKRLVLEDTLPLFRRTTLSNGVRVLTERIPSVRSISVGVWVDTGSRDETESESGMCHFIEHMVFKGTATRRMHQIAQRMESVGGYLNAFTTKEYTCYFARALDEHLSRSLDTVLDLVLEPSFPEKELDKEKDVVLEEMKMYEDNPEDLIYDRFEGIVYADHAMGRPIIGYPETVRSFTRDQLLSYVNDHYTPDRMVVTVTGKVDHEKVVRYVEKRTARGLRESRSKTRREVNGYGPRRMTEPRPIQQAHLLLGSRGLSAQDPRRTALSVLNTVLGGGMSSRLNQNIREKYGFCYNVYSFANMHSDAGDLGVYMGTDPARLDRAKTLIFRELDRLKEKPISDRVLGQARNQVKGSIMLGLENMSNRMMRLGRQELYYGRYFSLDDMIEQIEAVTPDDVQNLAIELFDREALSEVVLLPDHSNN
jgi:predicted Zn-dependent peptidase